VEYLNFKYFGQMAFFRLTSREKGLRLIRIRFYEKEKENSKHACVPLNKLNKMRWRELMFAKNLTEPDIQSENARNGLF
jgi:hypothetical protein